MNKLRAPSKIAGVLVLLATLAAGLPSSPARAQNASLLDTIKKNGVIRIGVAVDQPFTLKDKSGKWLSFVPDLDRMVGQKLGVKVQFVETTWTVIVAGLQADKYDMIGTSIYNTKERQKAIDFSIPYAYGGISYVGLKSAMGKLTSVSAINDPNVSVAVTTGAGEDMVTRRLFPKAKVVAFPNSTLPTLLTELFSKHVTLVGTASFRVPGLRLQFNNLAFLPNDDKGIEPLGICFGLRKDDPRFKSFLDAFITRAQKDGTIRMLQKKWLTAQNSTSTTK